MGVWYCTREAVKGSLDVKESAYVNQQIDDAIEGASRDIESQLNRVFYPTLATRKFDWPNLQRSRAYRLWLDQHELLSITSITSGGVAIPASNYLLEPVNDPPYDRVEINLSTTSAYSAGSTHQQNIVIVGLWGYDNVTKSAGTLTADINDSVTTISVSDSAVIGVGSLIVIGTERMLVVEKTMVDTTQNLGGSGLTASKADATVPVGTGSNFAYNEVILIDSERMKIVDISGNNLTVKRAWDGTVLATHATNADVYAARTLTVERGALGTTAAAHTNATAISVQKFPGLVNKLCVAESLNTFLQESEGYTRVVGTTEKVIAASGAALRDLRSRTYGANGRKARMRAV